MTPQETRMPIPPIGATGGYDAGGLDPVCSHLRCSLNWYRLGGLPPFPGLGDCVFFGVRSIMCGKPLAADGDDDRAPPRVVDSIRVFSVILGFFWLFLGVRKVLPFFRGGAPFSTSRSGRRASSGATGLPQGGLGPMRSTSLSSSKARTSSCRS